MICPHCKTTVTKVQDNICPECDKRVHKYKGVLYKEPPILAIISTFEKIITDKLSRDKSFSVPYYIPVKSMRYRVEQKTAKALLAEAEGDLELLLSAMLWLTGTKEYGWRITNSLLNFIPIINIGLSVMKAWREEQKKKLERSEAFKSYHDDLYQELQ
jgi:hypothetical protein